MINLTAVFKVRDQGTAQLRKITRDLERVEKAKASLSRQTKLTSKASGSLFGDMKQLGGMVGTVAGGIGSLVSKLNPVALGFKAIGTAAVAAYAGVKVFNATVGKAMSAEVSEITIGAMFDTKAQTDEYLKMTKKMALASPVLNYQDMAGGSKRILTLTRDMKVLEKTWKNVEKLQAFAPDKSTDEAIRTIAELASGDIVSMKDVFNMDKDQLNAIKDLKFEDQVEGLAKILDGMRITDDMINKVGDTAFAKWNQIKEKFDDILTGIGKPSLDALNKFFDNVLSRLEGEPMQKFAEWGGRVVKSVLKGLSAGAIKIYDWFTSFTSNPQFKAITTIQGKIDFVVTDIADKFKEWYDGGGQAKLQSFANTMVQFLTGVIDASPAFFNVATKIGGSIVAGIMDGIQEASGVSATGNLLKKLEKFNIATNIASKSMNLGRKIFGQEDATKEHSGTGRGFYHGIADVKYDNQPARLHRGERVLTAQENKEYSNRGAGGINIQFGDVTINKDADIDEIAYRLARRLEREMPFGI